MAQTLAYGKLKRYVETLEDSAVYVPDKGTIYNAETFTTINFIQLTNNQSSAVTFTLWIQYDEYELLITPKNYSLSPDDTFTITDEYYLGEANKIMAACSVEDGIDFIIHGTI